MDEAIEDGVGESGLADTNRGIVWIHTDDSAISDITNNQLLAAIPGNVGDGGPVTLDGQRTFIGQRLDVPRLKRFLVGPIECELTGFDMTPDGRTLISNIPAKTAMHRTSPATSPAAPARALARPPWPSPRRPAGRWGVKETP